MKILFTVIVLITFHFASAQIDISGTLKSSGDSVLFTDFKPFYKTHNPNFFTITIDKIEYTKEEMILYLSIVNKNGNQGIGFPIFGKKNEQALCLKSNGKIFNMLDIKNFMLNDTLYLATIPDDSSLYFTVNSGEKLTWEISFPRLPKEIKAISLIYGNDENSNNPFNYYAIKIKSTADSVGEAKEKNLLNKIELNKPLTLKNIYFETGKSNLLESSFTELKTLYNILNSKPKMIIQISGYTDNVGKAQDNIILSEARATAVKKYLSDKGIDNNRIIVKGYGSSNPKASNDTEEGRAQNRRVEITVLKNE
jgi:outer membrane protein OmpA-like peptidoglycan-associated protein